MKRVAGLSIGLVFCLLASCASDRDAMSASGRAAYGVFQGPEVSFAKRTKQPKVKKLRYSNGKGGTYTSSRFIRRNYGS